MKTERHADSAGKGDRTCWLRWNVASIRDGVWKRPISCLPDSPLLQTRCQPIAKADVIGYLAGCLENEKTAGQCFDIGGPEIVSYRELLERLARVAGTVNLYLPTPVIPPGLVGRWVGLFSRQDTNLVTALLEGLHNEVICEEQRIRRLIRLELTPLDRALKLALTEPPGP